jgi:hypothetical protein
MSLPPATAVWADRTVSGKDTVKVDIGFGGAFYAYVGTDELGLPPTSIVPQVRGWSGVCSGSWASAILNAACEYGRSATN